MLEKEFTKKNNGINQAQQKVLEIYFWMIVSMIPLFPAIALKLTNSKNGTDYEFFLDNYINILSSLLTLLLPLLVKLIFGKLPFEYIRNRNNKNKSIESLEYNEEDIQAIYPILDEVSEDYKVKCINESHIIAEKIFIRSGVYLLVGCLIAFAGITIFYSPWFNKISNNAEIGQRLLEYIPRFCALFFIEFIAFFFLKQYRIMLEEYRYYEAVKRKRQDALNLINLIEQYKNEPDMIKIFKEFSGETLSHHKLTREETTQILETQKILNQDTDIFGKFIDLVKEVKGK